jgi:hypothetical protein
LNGDYQQSETPDQNLLRGAKAIADKIDCGMVTAKVSPEELVTLDKVIRERGICPNQVSDIYKLRRGRYNDVRIWSEMDLGTCRIKDLFVTDVNFKPILDFYPITFTYDECDDDIQSILGFLNNRNDVPEIEKEVVITNNDEELSLESVNKTSINNWVF